MNRIGPKIVTDGLVLSYDVGDTKNSFLGAPTENKLFTVAGNTSPWTVGGINTDVTNTDEAGPIKGSSTWKFVKTGTSNQWNGWESSYGGIWTGASGDIWTTSYWYKTTAPAGASNFGIGNFYLGDWSRQYNATILTDRNTIIADGTWRYNYTTTRIDEAYTNAIIVDGPSWGYSSAAGCLYINGLQWEKKSYPTAFTTSTRSNTGGLINVSNPSSTLSLSNATFGADGSLSFNGSTSYVGVSNNILSSNSPYTLLAFLKPNGSNWGDNSMPLFNTYYADLGFWHHFGLDNGLAYRHYGSTSAAGTLSSIGLVANVWQMTAVTWDGYNIELYKNATLQSSAALTAGYTVNSGGRIGMLNARSVSSDYNWNGWIDIEMIYNRALSNNELIQIFNMQRNRFGI